MEKNNKETSKNNNNDIKNNLNKNENVDDGDNERSNKNNTFDESYRKKDRVGNKGDDRKDKDSTNKIVEDTTDVVDGKIGVNSPSAPNTRKPHAASVACNLTRSATTAANSNIDKNPSTPLYIPAPNRLGCGMKIEQAALAYICASSW